MRSPRAASSSKRAASRGSCARSSTSGFVDVGGWDTHVGQGGAEGYLANRLEELGRGVGRIRERNGHRRGPIRWSSSSASSAALSARTATAAPTTDTAASTGCSAAACAAGASPESRCACRRARLFQNRDYPVLNEYRAMFAGLFARMYGLNASQLERVFPAPAPSGVVVFTPHSLPPPPPPPPRSPRSSSSKRPTICTPSGRPSGPRPAGIVTHGTPSSVQLRLKSELPVLDAFRRFAGRARREQDVDVGEEVGEREPAFARVPHGVVVAAARHGPAVFELLAQVIAQELGMRVALVRERARAFETRR